LKNSNEKQTAIQQNSVPKPRRKSKTEIHREKVEAELDEIKAQLELMNSRIIEEIRNMAKKIIDELIRFLQGHSLDSEYIEVKSVKDYLNNLIPKYQDLAQPQDKSNKPI
jgi:phosphoglycerate-specific signal transduction histidine kinase